jgi:hypothetical protein
MQVVHRPAIAGISVCLSSSSSSSSNNNSNSIRFPSLLLACLQDETSLLMQQPLAEPLKAEGPPLPQQQSEDAGTSFGGTATADAWQGESEHEETEAGMPDNIVLVSVQLSILQLCK